MRFAMFGSTFLGKNTLIISNFLSILAIILGIFVFQFEDTLIAQSIGVLLIIYTLIFGIYFFTTDRNIYNTFLKIWYVNLPIPLVLTSALF